MINQVLIEMWKMFVELFEKGWWATCSSWTTGCTRVEWGLSFINLYMLSLYARFKQKKWKYSKNNGRSTCFYSNDKVTPICFLVDVIYFRGKYDGPVVRATAKYMEHVFNPSRTRQFAGCLSPLFTIFHPELSFQETPTG